ncbi:MarR family transcriptional regulator [Leptospira gomenensis]|uniref:MarR family transcriptional regulator n=2 Tax=Leptospira gomenensis TaxID=2484974 RepID=A0A5F1YL80_9LEPT|nr:MarR family transcriptional regulator [Leptospira gomenensis]TGK33378.1 MarR family transcriptional regulator [Leptospira gomenensis]TGK40516.1 MarR family transcriptional regulator [Leptospira gomenensis]TGK56438.1 MarR family transcriptional regulator [Leptospira gomenensis]
MHTNHFCYDKTMHHPDRIAHIISGISDKIFLDLTLNYKKTNAPMITPPLGAVLCALSPGKTFSMKELARKSLRDPSTVTPIVAKLEKLEFIKRIKSPKDNRMFEVTLTPQGKQVRSSVVRASRKMFSKIYRNTSQEERRLLMNLLEKIDSGL